MPRPNRNITREFFLVLDDLSANLSPLARKLDPISQCQENALLKGIDALYNQSEDTGLLCVRYSPRMLNDGKRIRMIYLASASGIEVLDPQRLTSEDQQQFYEQFLPNYSLRLNDYSSPNDALDALGKQLDSNDPAGWNQIATGTRQPAAQGTSHASGQAAIATSPSTISSTDKGQGLGQGLLVRYKRGDTWLPARLRGLSIKDVRLAASAAPPKNSAIQVAITVSSIGVALAGHVSEVTNTENSSDGSTSFRVDFSPMKSKSRARLIELLKIAKRIGLSLKAPPPRKSRRFAVTCPIAILADGNRLKAAALDVSEQGFFLGTKTPIDSKLLRFGLLLDRTGLAVRGEATIARAVTEQMARTQGLAQGYGLSIDAIKHGDNKAFSQFLERIKRRSQQHILVAGHSERSRQLVEFFQSSGYTVSNSQLLDIIHDENTTNFFDPDIAVVDYSAMDDEQGRNFETIFRNQRVKILKLRGHNLHLAREALDKMLSV